LYFIAILLKRKLQEEAPRGSSKRKHGRTTCCGYLPPEEVEE